MGERDGAFTPGPWTFHARHPQNACAEVYADDGCTSIATCYGGDDTERDKDTGIWGPQPTRDANARLIAAAPDLLAILERYMAAYPAFRIKPVGEPGSPKRVEQENLMKLEDAARSAIAAARTQGSE